MTNTKMRSGKLLARNDDLIEEMISDPDYQIAEDGSINTLICETGKRSVHGVWRPLYQDIKEGGYIRVAYKCKSLQLHRIVYRKFIGSLAVDLMINHIDGNPSNNHFSNLELVPQSKNNKHSYDELGKLPNRRTDVVGSVEVADQIREDHRSGFSISRLQKKYGVAKGTISEILNRHIWTEDSKSDYAPKNLGRKINQQIADQIRFERHQYDARPADLAEKFKVSLTTIKDVLANRKWKNASCVPLTAKDLKQSKSQSRDVEVGNTDQSAQSIAP